MDVCLFSSTSLNDPEGYLWPDAVPGCHSVDLILC